MGKKSLLATIIAAIFGGSGVYLADDYENSVTPKLNFFAGTIPAVATWTSCAGEGQTCAFTGTREVRFGTTKRKVAKSFTGSTVCSNTIFGDPDFGVPKTCSYSSEFIAGTDSGGTGLPASLDAYDAYEHIIGPVDLFDNQVLTKKRISSTTGPCIEVRGSNVKIIEVLIEGCGTSQNITENQGVHLNGQNGALGNLEVTRSIIKDVSTGVNAVNFAKHPIVTTHNWFHNIRGPFPAGQMVKYDQLVYPATQVTSKINCNYKDGRITTHPWIVNRTTTAPEDHFSLGKGTGGQSGTNPLEIKWNSVRGEASGAGRSGTGVQMSDQAISHNILVEGNTFIKVNGAGISMNEGGDNIVFKNNRIDQRGENAATQTSYVIGLRRGSGHCSGPTRVKLLDNVTAPATGWAWNGGATLIGVGAGDGCSPINNTSGTETPNSNNYQDAVMTANTPDQNWDTFKTHVECGGSGGGGGAGTNPTYSSIQIFPMPEAPASVDITQDRVLKFRFFGVPHTTDLKAAIHLVDSNNQLKMYLQNDYWLFGAHSTVYGGSPPGHWLGGATNGYVEYDFRTHVPALRFIDDDAVASPPGTYRVLIGLYQGYSPYAYNPNIYECRNAARIVDSSGFTGCYVGDITINAASGTPDTTLTAGQLPQIRPISRYWTP